MHQTLLSRFRHPDRRCCTLNKCSFYGRSVLVIPPPYGVEHESQKVANLQPHERSIIEKPNLQANKTTMTSNALSDWQTVRFVRLDELFSIVGPSQRLDLIEVLVMRLAAEWQGFLRYNSFGHYNDGLAKSAFRTCRSARSGSYQTSRVSRMSFTNAPRRES
jgi:hypothetical protein